MKKISFITTLLLIVFLAGCSQRPASGPPATQKPAGTGTASPMIDQAKQEEIINQGQEAFEKGDYHQAITLFSKALKDDEDNSVIRTKRGLSYMHEYNFTEALKDYENALKTDPESPGYRLNRGDALLELNKFEDAKKDILFNIKMEPKNSAGYFSMARLLHRQGETEKSLKYLDRAIQLNPKDFAYYSLRSAIYLDQDKLDEAEAEIKKAMEILPNNAGAYSTLSTVYYRRNQVDKAIEILNEALAKIPDSQRDMGILEPTNKESLYNGLAGCYLIKKEYNKALDAHDKALKINPDFLPALSGKLTVLDKLGKPEKRFELAQLLMEKITSPRNHEDYLYLGIACSILKKRDKAMEYFNKAIEIKPKDSQAYFQRGGIYWRDKKDAKRAREDLTKVLQDKHSAPLNLEGAKKMLKEIEDMKSAKPVRVSPSAAPSSEPGDKPDGTPGQEA